VPNIKQNAINPAVDEPLGQGILARASVDVSADMVVSVTGQFGAHFEVAPVANISPGSPFAGFNNLYVARHSASAGEYVVILPWKTIQVTRLSLDPAAKIPGGAPIFVVYVDPNTGLYTADLDQVYNYYAGGSPLVLPVANVIDQGNPGLPDAERIVTLQVNPSGKLNGVVTSLFNTTVTLPAGVTSLAWPMTTLSADLKSVITSEMVIVASVSADDTGSSIGTLLSATLWPSAPGVYDTVQLRWEAAGTAGDARIRLQCFWPML
jgi:hypothetical protein